MSFYCVLPSNSSVDYFPDNRISSYKVKLPHRIIGSQEEYEVALMECTYKNTIKTVWKDEVDRTISIIDSTQPDGKAQGAAFVIPDINYSSIITLLNEISKGLEDLQNETITVTLLKETNRVEVDIKSGSLLISSAVSQALGFRGNRSIDSSTLAMEPPKAWNGMSHIFIYSDIIEPQVVGNSLVPLLRMVNIVGEEGQIITQTFRPFYFPVQRTDFDTVSILLCNEYGEEIQFQGGIAAVIVHFRKRK